MNHYNKKLLLKLKTKKFLKHHYRINKHKTINKRKMKHYIMYMTISVYVYNTKINNKN